MENVGHDSKEGTNNSVVSSRNTVIMGLVDFCPVWVLFFVRLVGFFCLFVVDFVCGVFLYACFLNIMASFPRLMLWTCSSQQSQSY